MAYENRALTNAPPGTFANKQPYRQSLAPLNLLTNKILVDNVNVRILMIMIMTMMTMKVMVMKKHFSEIAKAFFTVTCWLIFSDI